MVFESRNVDVNSRLSKHLAISSLLVAVALLIVPFVWRLDGKPHADWEQFLGRFHPLAVHLPIGLILLIPLLEIAGYWRPAMREAAEFVLVLSVFSCFGSVMLGYLLAFGSGESGTVVFRHMWCGIWLTIGVCCCQVVRP